MTDALHWHTAAAEYLARLGRAEYDAARERHRKAGHRQGARVMTNHAITMNFRRALMNFRHYSEIHAIHPEYGWSLIPVEWQATAIGWASR